jgi:arsenite oxidase small subunit
MSDQTMRTPSDNSGDDAKSNGAIAQPDNFSDVARASCSASAEADCVSRRGFLAFSGIGTATLLLGEVFPGRVHGQDDKKEVEVAKLARKKVGQLSLLKSDMPVDFHYPQDGLLTGCMLVKLGEKAGGGIGPAQDVVAFSTRCTHMGGDMQGAFNAEHKVAGPCPEHLTTFDLTRHGMVVAGHATQSLTQVILELDGDDIYASGLVGLLYGYSDNALA